MNNKIPEKIIKKLKQQNDISETSTTLNNSREIKTRNEIKKENIKKKVQLIYNSALFMLDKGNNTSYIKGDDSKDPVKLFYPFLLLKDTQPELGFFINKMDENGYTNLIMERYYNILKKKETKKEFSDKNSEGYKLMKNLCNCISTDIIKLAINSCLFGIFNPSICLVQTCGPEVDNEKADALNHHFVQSPKSRVAIFNWDLCHSKEIENNFNDKDVLVISINTITNNQNRNNGNEELSKNNIRKNISLDLKFNDTINQDILFLFHQLLLPILLEFNPDFVLIPTHFNRNEKHKQLNTSTYIHLLYYLSMVQKEKLILAVEVDNSIENIKNIMEECVKLFMGKNINSNDIPTNYKPSEEIISIVKAFNNRFKKYWMFLN
ncbi:hypothetical protein K502DRAFT_342829 [Neoconidiobolus thromboides FSU 785]|nr:hypothetical protein K502DRAFT_342829 [Neoconidiobolus thromboides FSU 785]